MKRFLLLAAGACVSTAIPHDRALAQDRKETGGTAAADDIPLGADIVVTARRRAEDVSKVPISVTAFSGEQLQLRNVVTTSDLTKLTPGLNISGAGSRLNPYVTIRGQTRGSTGTASPGVITYFNDVPLATYGSILQTFDMDNIQVLKGPQGTLFGRNSVGGALLTYSRAPSHSFGGYATIEGGNFDHYQFEGAINVPVIRDVLAVRLATQLYHDGGFSKTYRFAPYTANPTNPTAPATPGALIPTDRNLDEYDGRLLRATVLLEPASGIRNTTVVDYTHVRGTNSVRFDRFLPNGYVSSVISAPTPAAIFTTTNLRIISLFRCSELGSTNFACDWRAFDQVRQNTKGRVSYTNGDPNDGLTKLFGVTNNTAVKLGSSATLKNIFSYRTTAVNTVTDTDGTPFILSATAQQIRLRQITEELQLAGEALHDRLKYTLGGFYLNSKPNGLGGFGALDLNSSFGTSNSLNTTYLHETSKALYGQADYALDFIVKGLNATAGYRHTWDESSGCVSTITFPATAEGLGRVPNRQGAIPSEAQCLANNIPSSMFPAVNTITTGNFASKFNKGTFALGLNWQISSSVMTYIARRRGYRAGNFNASRYSAFLSTVQNFKPEVIDDWELGTKLRWTGSLPGTFDIALFRGVDSGLQFPEGTAGMGGGFCVPAAISSTETPCTTTAAQTAYPVGTPGRLVGITSANIVINKGSAVIKGFELAGTISPVTGLTLGASASYTKFNTKKLTMDSHLAAVFQAANLQPANQIFVLNQPQWTANANITYQYPQKVLGGSLILTGDFHYSDGWLSGNLFVQSYRTVDTRLTLQDIGGSGVDASIFARNLFDEKYDFGSAGSAAVSGYFSYIPAPPRTVGMSLRYRFGS